MQQVKNTPCLNQDEANTCSKQSLSRSHRPGHPAALHRMNLPGHNGAQARHHASHPTLPIVFSLQLVAELGARLNQGALCCIRLLLVTPRRHCWEADLVASFLLLLLRVGLRLLGATRHSIIVRWHAAKATVLPSYTFVPLPACLPPAVPQGPQHSHHRCHRLPGQGGWAKEECTKASGCF